MHRLIMSRILGRDLMPDEHVDHKDTNPLNNTRENLRLASVQQNNRNGGLSSSNTSGYVGVSWSKQFGKWETYIAVNKRRKHLGLFDDPVKAARVRDWAALKYHGEYAYLNFPWVAKGETAEVNVQYLQRLYVSMVYKGAIR